MSSYRSSSGKLPSVLSIPEKLSGVTDWLLRLRFPLERRFSGRDVLLAFLGLLFLVLSLLIRSFARFRFPICICSACLAAVPLVLQAVRQIRHRRIPFEEATWLVSSAVAFLLKEPFPAALLPVLAVFLCQAEAYCLLHKEAAPDYLWEAQENLKKSVETADEEKSGERKLLASAALAFYALYLLIGLVFAVCALFHLQDYRVWIHRGLIFFVLAGPSAFLFASVLTHFGAVYSAAKSGILFADDQIPELFSKCRLFAFSKTGTITDGCYIISELAPVGISKDDLLRIAAIAECQSEHPIAAALKAAAGLEEGGVPKGLMSTEEIPGKGVSALFSGHQIYAGNAGLLEDHEIWYQIPTKSGSAVHIAVDGTYRGYILISDALREHAFEALEELRALGATTLVMLTGDVRSAARTLASSLNFDMVKPELSPKEKGSAIRYLRSVHGDRARIACVGDGVHDSEMFDAADVSVSLEPRSEEDGGKVTVFSSDITLIPHAYRICRETERTLLIDTAALAGSKILLAILGAAAVLPASAVLLTNFVFEAGAVFYALMCLMKEKKDSDV